MNTTPHVLVTGGAGYLGSILVPSLLARGCAVTVVDSFLYGQTSLLDCCADEKLSIVRGDVRDERLMLPLLKKADVIMPLACLVGPRSAPGSLSKPAPSISTPSSCCYRTPRKSSGSSPPRATAATASGRTASSAPKKPP